MLEVVDDCVFEKDKERVTLFRRHSESFTVRVSTNKGLILKDKGFIKYKDAEDFYDSFAKTQDVKNYLNKMLKIVNAEGRYKAVLL